MDGGFLAAEVAQDFIDAVLRGIVFERLMDVRVRGRVAAKYFSQNGDGPFEIAVEPKAEEATGGLAEFEHEDFATGLGDSMHFAQAGFNASEVAQSVGDGDEVEMVVGLLVFERIALQKCDGRITVARGGLVEHGLAEVDAGDLGATPGQREGDVASATAKVERTLAFGGICEGDEAGFPVAMETEALEVVDEIIARGDGVEEVAHALGACFVVCKIAVGHWADGSAESAGKKEFQ